MNLRINLTAWGTHVQTMRSVLFPSLLSPGNLPALAARHSITIDLCSTPVNFDDLLSCPHFIKIAEYADVDFVEVEPNETRRVHQILSACHRHTLGQRCDGCLFIQPDMIIADGALRWLAEVIPDANAVLVATPRAILGNAAALSFPVTPRRLMRFMLDHKHPVTDSLIVNKMQSSIHPSHLYWQAGSDGFAVRAFHMHPLFIVPRGDKIGNTIDGDYLQTYYPDGERFVYATNSDDMAIIELSQPQHMGRTIIHEPATFDQIKKWMRGYTLPIHRQHAKQKIRLIADFTDQSAWDECEDEAEEFTRMFL